MMFVYVCGFFFFKQKTAYEMRISDWSSDVCSSDLLAFGDLGKPEIRLRHARFAVALREDARCAIVRGEGGERPKDIDQIFLTAVSAAPHVVVAVRELAHLARMDLDRLREVELDAVASRPQYPLDRR